MDEKVAAVFDEQNARLLNTPAGDVVKHFFLHRHQPVLDDRVRIFLTSTDYNFILLERDLKREAGLLIRQCEHVCLPPGTTGTTVVVNPIFCLNGFGCCEPSTRPITHRSG